MKDDFYQILIYFNIVDCTGFVYSESPVDGGSGDSEGRHDCREKGILKGGQ